MAHEITVRKDGKAEIAHVGETPWHGLGQKLTPDASIETWIREAGLDWEALAAPVRFYPTGTSSAGKMQTFKGRNVIFRSDSLLPMGVTSDDYKIVQPREVIEFFKEAAGQANMKLEVAGSMFGGKRFWATARVNEEELKLAGKDEVRPYVLLITSIDGSLATNASLVATRVVCNNTARIALAESGRRVRVVHTADFDPNIIKSKLGLIDATWANFKDRITKLSKTKVSEQTAKEFFLKLHADPNAIEQRAATVRKADDLFARFMSGIGADMHKGTAWGLYCAVTEQTNYKGRGAMDHRMHSALFGSNAKLVEQAEAQLAELVP